MSVSASDAQVAECTARAVAGDRASYEALFRLRCAFVEAEAARRLGRRRDLVDDVAQDAWLRVARGPRRCPDVASLDAWLRRVVRSAAIDLLRSELACRLREERAAMDRPEAVDFIQDFELLEQIRRDVAAIGGISDDERAVLELRARADATLAQLARWLGIGQAAVDSRLRRAVERARAHARSETIDPAGTRAPFTQQTAHSQGQRP